MHTISVRLPDVPETVVDTILDRLTDTQGIPAAGYEDGERMLRVLARDTVDKDDLVRMLRDDLTQSPE